MFDLGEVGRVIGAESAPPAVAVAGWSVDSRTVRPGELFFALPGPKHDGHDFVAEAFAKGAVAAVVERPMNGAGGPALRVASALGALEALAAWARRQWKGAVVAVTGSAGKTTTKDVIAHLLATEMPVGKTEGNLNNQVGLPLSILRLPAEARVAVLELAMNHAGEIRRLAGIAQPEFGVVTNVGHAHAGFFGSLEEVALAKRELIEALPAAGVAVLNADDPRVARFAEIHPGRVITFGLSAGAAVCAERVEYSPDGVRFRVGATQLESRLAGRHGVLNILAGLAVARGFGIETERLAEAVRQLAPGSMRGQRFTHAGVTILDDCYNSNPEAARAMLELLRAIPARRRVAVLGEMLELGRWSEGLHGDVGRYVAECGIDLLVGIRGAARILVEQAVRSGLSGGAAFFFEDPDQAGEWLRELLKEGDAVLFKGSRGTQVERALARFLERGGQERAH
ncbi:MAG: UDP-N-acetylmuramoyl-tripeptide--D-alanyl-D-alanine ligase [Acidobacteriota bacterium]